jgi:hypothetical protein
VAFSPPFPPLLRGGGEGDRFWGRRTQGRNAAPKPPAFRPWATFLNPFNCAKPGEPEGSGQAEFSLVLLARDEHGLLGHLYPGQGLLVGAAGEWQGNPTADLKPTNNQFDIF